MIPHQSSPSLDGVAAQFSLGGSHRYSNEFYWHPLGGGRNVSHVIFDVWFYIDAGNAPQALEFDVNQAFGGTRWTWGSECDFNQTGKWKLWDDLHRKWIPTYADCNYFRSKTWVHLVWTLERVRNQVHYISLSVRARTTRSIPITRLSQNGTRKKSTSLFRLRETTSNSRTLFGWMR